MADSILKKIGIAVKNLVDTTRTNLQANIDAITPTTLGLGNVNNTSDLNKPISTATQAALDTKQNIDATMVFDGSYVHTDNNYTTPEKTKVGFLTVTQSVDLDAIETKLDGIETGATADQTAPEILTLVKTVDGASSGLDADLLDGQEGAYYTNYTDTKIAALVASSPATLDTLNELATALGNDPNFATTIATQIGTKLDASSYTASDVLTKVKTVDGSGSGLDADLLDDREGSYYLDWTNTTNKPTTLSGYGITDALSTSGGTLNGNLIINGSINRTTGNGTARWLQQDGTGRQHWYWNTTGGNSPTFEVAGEGATDIMHHADNAGNEHFTFRAASGVNKLAGDSIVWENVLYADRSGTFQYKGSNVVTAANASSTLPDTGVVAGSYGSATNIPVITFDAKGRATSASTVAVSIPSGSISVTGGDLTLSGNTGTAITNATLSVTGVTAGTYKSVTVDAKGRVTAGTNPTTPFDVCQFINGKPFASESVVKIIAPRAISIPANMTGSYFRSGATATASTVLTVYKNGVSAGTVTFAAGSSTGTASTTAISLVAGDLLTLVAPASIDATFADFVCTITGTM